MGTRIARISTFNPFSSPYSNLSLSAACRIAPNTPASPSPSFVVTLSFLVTSHGFPLAPCIDLNIHYQSSRPKPQLVAVTPFSLPCVSLPPHLFFMLPSQHCQSKLYERRLAVNRLFFLSCLSQPPFRCHLTRHPSSLFQIRIQLQHLPGHRYSLGRSATPFFQQPSHKWLVNLGTHAPDNGHRSLCDMIGQTASEQRRIDFHVEIYLSKKNPFDIHLSRWRSSYWCAVAYLHH